MEERKLTEGHIRTFHQYLIREEKSTATVEKYLRDVRAFAVFMGAETVAKEQVMAYKQTLRERGYAVRSINSMLASLNSLLDFLGWSDCKVKSIRQQKQTYCAEEKELSRIPASAGNGQGKAAASAGDADHLRHRYPGVGTEVLHRRGGKSGGGCG